MECESAGYFAKLLGFKGVAFGIAKFCAFAAVAIGVINITLSVDRIESDLGRIESDLGRIESDLGRIESDLQVLKVESSEARAERQMLQNYHIAK